MRDFNIDRDSISSEEVSTFKDFKSILRKHSQTSEDLAKIKPVKNNSILYWSIGIIGILATSTLIVLNSSYESPVEDKLVVNDFVETKKRLEDKPSKSKPVLIENSIEWSTIIKTPKQPISELVNAQTFSASRIEYVEFDSFKDIKTLLPGIQKSDADFVLNTIVFKIEHKEEITVSNKNELYKFGEESKWLKVDFKPVLMPFIEKPNLYHLGENGLKVHFKDFKGPASKYKNVYWKPIDINDYDEVDQIIANGLTDIKVKNADINGVYNLTFISDHLTVRINAYPCLIKEDFDLAMKEYNFKLQKAQEAMISSPKQYLLEKGIYTIK
jgi:hypothetical protein